MLELRAIWRWAWTHERRLSLVPLVLLAALATVADLALVAGYFYDAAQGLHGVGTSPFDAVLGEELHRTFAPLMLAFLLLGTPGTLYVGVLLIGPPLIWLARRIGG